MGDEMDFTKKDWKTYLIVIFVSIIVIAIGKDICSYKVDNKYDLDYYTAEVLSIQRVEELHNESNDRKIYFTAKVLDGPYKNQIVNAFQKVENTDAYKVRDVKVNDKIVIIPSKTLGFAEQGIGDDALWTFSLFKTSNYLIILVIFFLLMIIAIGKWKGINTILALAITTLLILLVFIPSILKGYNIYISTLLCSFYIIISSLLLINGFNKKTLCAIVGNIFGILVAAIIALIMNKVLNINGLINENYIYLSLVNPENPIDLRAMIWSGIIIGSLGAIMDVAMAIASSMHELNEKMKDKSFKSMFVSGMNIGKDSIGTMANTLILAYIGCSMSTVLLLFSYNKNLLYLFNIEAIIIEVLQAVIGSIGILLTVPLTAAFSAWIFNRKEKRRN